MILFLLVGALVFAGVNSAGGCEVQEEHFDKDEFASRLNYHLDTFLKYGNKSDFIDEVVSMITIGKDDGRSTIESNTLKATVTCLACQITVEYMRLRRKYGADRDSLASAAISICNLVTLYSMQKVCNGVIYFNIDTFLYIFDNKPDLTGELACATVLQDKGCKSKKDVEWSVNLPAKGIDIRSLKTSICSKPLKIVHITDIHYDPRYKIGGYANCANPLCCQNDDADPPNGENKAGFWGDYKKCDAPLHLVLNSFEEIIKQHPDIDLVYFTGDIIAHRVWNTSVEGNTKDIRLILKAMKERFKTIPIFPILGNHEPHPLNVFPPSYIQNSNLSIQWLYDLVADEWGVWLPEDTKHTIKKGGFYTTLVRPGFRIIGLNSNVGYVYNWWNLYDSADPDGQLQWLADTLHSAEKNSEIVHILTHVPSNDVTCNKFWCREFRRVLERFHKTVTGVFFGHTHFDEFVVYYDISEVETALSVAYNGGSITPYEDLNPNYRVYEVNGATYDVLDYEQWIFNLSTANLNKEKPPEWYKLYSFKQHYGVPDMKPQTLAELVEGMAQFRKLSEKYNSLKFKHSDSALAKECDKNCLMNNICDIVRNEFLDDRKCKSLVELYDNNND